MAFEGGLNMTRFNYIERRVRIIKLLERVDKKESYSRKIGILDESHFRYKSMKEKEN